MRIKYKYSLNCVYKTKSKHHTNNKLFYFWYTTQNVGTSKKKMYGLFMSR